MLKEKLSKERKSLLKGEKVFEMRKNDENVLKALNVLKEFEVCEEFEGV